jgi:hypothetical protein
MAWRRWFETATHMIDGVFDHLPVTAAVHDGLDGDFLLLDVDEAQASATSSTPLVPSTSRIKIRSRRVLCLRIRLCAVALSESGSFDALVARIETLKTSSED